MKNFLLQILDYIILLLSKLSIKFSKNKYISIINLTYDNKGRFLVYHLINNNLSDSKSVLRNIFYTLLSDERFKSFGSKKVIIITAVKHGEEFSYHHNVLITNTTTFSAYYKSIEEAIIKNYDNGYSVDIIPEFKVRVWNMDEFSNKTIKITKNATISSPVKSKGFPSKNIMNSLNKRRMFSNYIRPIKAHNIDHTCDSIATMDIETIEVKGFQVPISISVAYFDSIMKSKLFLINHSLFKKYPNKAINLLWKQYFDFITTNNQFFKNIFVHNLGSFDGLFLHKALSNHYSKSDMISTIIDDKNKFIQITLIGNKFKINWKDSYRIFSVSLNDLCKIFGVSGKTSKYDIKFNSIKLFEDVELLTLFKKYSLQDSVSLYQALDRAQYIYSKDYSVDIASTLSASSLSLKIFRLLFLKTDIPILKGSEDSFIRKGYFGGHTDYFKAYAKKLFYYDINSLYPHAMLKPMPTQVKKFYSLMDGLNLNDLFGFFLVEIECPTNIKYPFIPFRDPNINGGGVIYPTGKWTGTYFSELLKFAELQGYKIKLIKGYSFYDEILFKEYVEHFYELKKNSFGSTRWIAKMHLNQLYGYFGRSLDLIQTENVN